MGALIRREMALASMAQATRVCPSTDPIRTQVGPDGQ
jgi:hypothetical protein